MSTGRLGAGDTAIQPTLLDAKGDLVTATAADTPARLAVGNNGETLVADSGTATGLRWQADTAAGKNLIINGAMDFWQRGTSVSGADAGGTNFLADRWGSQLRSTQSRETDVPSGLFKYSLKLVKAIAGGGLPGQFWQGIEPQTFTSTGNYTLSFYAKSTNITSITVNVLDRSTAVGEGGTTNATIYSSSAITISSSWQRYSVTFSLSSLSFTGDRIGIYIGNSSVAVNDNLFLTGVQLEFGSVATSFARAGGTLQGELAACQRYYYRTTANATFDKYGWAHAPGTTSTLGMVQLAVPMRVTPTALDYASIDMYLWGTGGYTPTAVTLNSESTANVAVIESTGMTGLTQNRMYAISAGANTSYLGFSAEL